MLRRRSSNFYSISKFLSRDVTCNSYPRLVEASTFRYDRGDSVELRCQNRWSVAIPILSTVTIDINE